MQDTETCAMEHADYYTGHTRQHELDHTNHKCHTDQQYIYLP